MELRIVNSVWRGELTKEVGTVDLAGLRVRMMAGLNDIKLIEHQTQPEQLVIRFVDGSTVLFFKSGKFRIMGGKIDDLEKHCNIYAITALFDQYPKLTLQTLTAAYAYPFKINLYELSDNIESHLNAESFPALLILKYKPITVNVFASGKVTICGLKDFETAQRIEEELDWLLCCIFLRRNLC